MSNDKVAATFSGGDPALARTIESAEIKGYAQGYGAAQGRPTPQMRDWAAARNWARKAGYRAQTSEPFDYASIDRPALYNETTGEHFKAKLTDNPYRHAVDPKDVPPAVAAEAQIPAYGLMQDYAEADVRLTNEMADRLYAELYPQPVPKRSRMLTPTEIIMSLLIIGAIVAGFIFTVFVIKIW